MWLRILKWTGGVALLLVVLVVAAIAAFGWNWLRTPIERQVEAATGRALRIDGDLHVGLHWPALTLSVEDVTLSNPAWAANRQMLEAGRVALSLEIPPLIHRRMVFDTIEVADADAHLERNRAGQGNWQFKAPEERPDSASKVEIGRVRIERGRFSYAEQAEETQIQGTVETSSQGGVQVTAEGKFRREPVHLRAVGGNLMSLRDPDRPYPFRGLGDYGKTKVRADGTVTGIGQLAALDAYIEVEGANVGDLYPLLQVAVPETGPYRVAGRVVKNGAEWHFDEIDARMGDSDFSGNLALDMAAKPPGVRGDIAFGKLDFADLLPTMGKKDAKKPKPKHEPGKRVLPDERFRTERWGTLNADLRLKASHIIRKGQLPIEHFATHLILQNAALSLDPLEFGVAEGKLSGTVRLDGRREPLHAEIDLHARRIVFAKLFPGVENKRAEIGRLYGDLKLDGKGNSLGKLLASANGKGAFVVSRGEVSRLMMELAGLHVLEAVVVAVSGDKPIVIRCGVAGFEVKNGVMHSEQFVLDTTITKILGIGTADFGREEIDVTLRPQAKETSLVSLHSPIHVVGPFGDPEVKVDKKALLARGAGALALGAINPVLALVPLIEIGREEGSDCAKLLQEVRHP
jgi:AsmA protein